MTVVAGIGGRLLAAIDTNGLKNHDAAMSVDGRFVAAATFTADVKVGVGVCWGCFGGARGWGVGGCGWIVLPGGGNQGG